MANSERPTARFALDLGVIFRLILIASVIVVCLGVVRELVMARIGTGTPLKELRHIALDSELSLPAWYSSMLLFFIAGLLALIGRAARAVADRDAGRWLLLAAIFLAMSLDEAASFHESLMVPLREGLGLTGILYYAWVVPGAIGVALIGAFFLPFVLRLPRRTAALIVLAGALFVGGALGMELIGGALEEAVTKQSLAYSIVSTIEESLEIAGLTVFVLALVRHVGGQWEAVAPQITARPQRAPAARMAFVRRKGISPEISPLRETG